LGNIQTAKGAGMNKKVLFIALPVVIIIAIGGFLYWKFITSPEYSLAKIKESIENHDVTAFEKYVDVDGIIMRLMSQVPQIIGGNKKDAMFGEEINQLILSLVQGPLLKIAKEGVRTVIERGHFDKSITQTDLMSQLLKQVPINTIKIIGLKKIHKQGKVCTIPIQIYVGAYEGETTLELMMRDKGSYWQVAEIRNLPKLIYDVAELQKTFPYRNTYAAVLYMANMIKDAWLKAMVLRDIAASLAEAGNVEKAEEVFLCAIGSANSIQDENRKSWALGEIASALPKAGKIEKAMEIADSLEDALFKGIVFCEIATELARAGKLDKALGLADSIKDERTRAEARGGIAIALAKAGKIEKAVELADEIKDEDTKAGALGEIATALARGGRIEETMETVNSIKDKNRKSWALGGIATALAKAGNFERAMEISDQIENERTKARALGEIGTALAKVGNIAESDVVFARALETGDSIHDADSKSWALGGVATALAKAGKVDRAEAVFSKAIQTADSIKNENNKTWALAGIATALAKAGNIRKAGEVFLETSELAGSINDSDYTAHNKARAFRWMAIEMVKVKGKDKREDAEIANFIMTALNR